MTVRAGLALASRTGAAGAWLLDLPGCHSAGDDETLALAGVPAALQRYSEVRAKHRVGGPTGPSGAVEVAERVVVEWHGWQPVDTAFFVDRAAATAADVRSTEAMLAATRAELLAAAERAGPGKAGDRTVEDMLAHVAGAEWWWFWGPLIDHAPRVLRVLGHRDAAEPTSCLAAETHAGAGALAFEPFESRAQQRPGSTRGTF